MNKATLKQISIDRFQLHGCNALVTGETDLLGKFCRRLVEAGYFGELVVFDEGGKEVGRLNDVYAFAGAPIARTAQTQMHEQG